MSIYLVCYDIADDGLRRRVADHLGAWGERVQRSVFEVRFANPAGLERLRGELSRLLQAEPEAELRLYRLCVSCRRASSTLAGEPVAVFPTTVIV